jgi:AP-3 complex subunit beta
MKTIIALIAKGHDTAEFVPWVCQQIVSTDELVRQLAWICLDHCGSEVPEVAIMTLNTFQRVLHTHPDPLVRATALRSLSSLLLVDALPIVEDAIGHVIGDPCPYVKKAAAFAIVKAAEVDPEQIDVYLEHVQRLLADTSPIAVTGALTAFWNICPDNIEFLHPRFRFLCLNIHRLDEFGQVFALRALTVYSRDCFKNPSAVSADEEANVEFWDDTYEQDAISPDHFMAIHTAKRMLSSPSAAVTIAAVAFLFYCAPPSQLAAVGKPLVRLLYEGEACAEIALRTVDVIAAHHQHVFA